MESWGSENFGDCQLGDKRLNQRALEIGQALVVGFGQALSMIFEQENPLKRADEFLANPKAQFNKRSSAPSGKHCEGDSQLSSCFGSRRYKVSR
jgi:hypothetical protein